MKNNIPIYGIATIILIVFRCIFNDNEQLMYIIAFINLIALLLVIFSVTEKTKKQIVEKISLSGAPKEICDREVRSSQIVINLVVYIPVLVLYIVYFVWFTSELWNDILSILALGLSLSDEHIVKALTDIYKI